MTSPAGSTRRRTGAGRGKARAAVRIGVIGLGMGAMHARMLRDGKVPGGVLTAVCDLLPARLAPWRDVAGVHCFDDAEALLRSDVVDAVIVATPHYAHTTLGIAALQHGLHLLVEKPISVHKADCERLIAAHVDPTRVFAAMFNQRTDPYFRHIRELLQGGTLGAVQRVNWIITDWFRPEAYYRSGGWRATWAGEGGGVLMNQCPHNLDLLCWLFGLPVRVRAFAGFGKHHDIEVEDEVTAYLEYANGATGVFVASTGEAPGTNRLEVTCDGGRLVYEHDVLTLTRNATLTSEFSRSTRERFAAPATTTEVFSWPDHGGQHLAVLQNFVAAIAQGAMLVAPAAEGIHSVELANAMLLSAAKSRSVDLPLDAAAYARHLKRLVANSRGVRPDADAASVSDLARSFPRK
jgi:predicted dehydrogenase